MIQMLLTAPASGTGKTTLTCALLGALKRRGLDPCAFKCGPDYIDPMFHRSVLGVESHNLDLFLSDEAHIKALFAQASAGHGAVVCEGAMGFYDGLGGSTDRASAWHVAHTLKLPVILVIQPRGASLTLAAQIKGLMDFRPESHIAGIILNDCRESLFSAIGPMLERETGIPVLGCLPRLEEVEIQSRHLGLYTAGEIDDLHGRIRLLADALERHVDLERLLSLCQGAEPPAVPVSVEPMEKAVIAVAQDEAFCFLYQESLEALERAGAELVWFSPLHDTSLPWNAGGLYLPGGYPELYTKSLSDNAAMRESVRSAVADGLPTVAECGGFLYLGTTLENEAGEVWPMVGALPGAGVPTGKLVRFGYADLIAREDSLLFRQGERVPIHEFHYWDSTENGTDLDTEKPTTGRRGQCGFATPSLYAAFPHLYLAGHPQMTKRFVQAALDYSRRERTPGRS